MKKFKETLVREIEFSELDLQWPFYDEDGNPDEPMWNEIKQAENIWSDTVSMNLDDAINTLQTLKQEGANRLYIVVHEDHVGYIFTGVKLEEV